MSTSPFRRVRCGLIWALCASVASATSLPIHTETIPIRDGKPLTIEMVLIPGGTFHMGSPASEAGHEAHEGPPQAVQVNPFYLCTTEITIELFLAYYEETHTTKKAFERAEAAKKRPGGEVDAITGPTAVFGDMTMGYDHQHPAIGMTWRNGKTFCRWLTQKTGKPYRLPTEAEWEYAYRAGGQEAYGSVSDTETLPDYAWYADNADGTNPVAQKKPNAWGLHDMGGNVSEWVLDFYSAKTYAERTSPSPVVDPQGPKTGRVHVARGGDFGSSAQNLRCAARGFEEDFWRFGDPQFPKSKWWLPELDIIGVRVAMSRGADSQE